MRLISTSIILLIFSVLSIHYNWLITPQSVSSELREMIETGELYSHVSASLYRVVSGLIIGISLAVSLACLGAAGGPLGHVVHFWAELLRPIPPIAWIPAAILWQGLGNGSAITVVTIGAFFPTFISTYVALRSCPEDMITVAKSLGATGWKLFVYVKIPHAIPDIILGVQISIGLSWMTVIAAELIGAQSGLGYVIQSSRLILDFDRILIGMAIIGIIGFLMAATMRLLIAYFAPFVRN